MAIKNNTTFKLLNIRVTELSISAILNGEKIISIKQIIKFLENVKFLRHRIIHTKSKTTLFIIKNASIINGLYL